MRYHGASQTSYSGVVLGNEVASIYLWWGACVFNRSLDWPVFTREIQVVYPRAVQTLQQSDTLLKP
jgi:hypothetical protein